MKVSYEGIYVHKLRLRLEKKGKAGEWGLFNNQIILYGLRDTFDVDMDHKPLVPLLSSYRMPAPLHVAPENESTFATVQEPHQLPARQEHRR